VEGCKYFTFYLWNKCSLAGEDSKRVSKRGVRSGLPHCTSCYKRNVKYSPYMNGFEAPGRSEEKSPRACQARCQDTPKCKYFSWFSDGGCRIAGEGAEEQTDSRTISGPATCSVPEPLKKPASEKPPVPPATAPQPGSQAYPGHPNGRAFVNDAASPNGPAFVDVSTFINGPAFVGVDTNIQAPRAVLGVAVGVALAVAVVVLGVGLLPALARRQVANQAQRDTLMDDDTAIPEE